MGGGEVYSISKIPKLSWGSFFSIEQFWRGCFEGDVSVPRLILLRSPPELTAFQICLPSDRRRRTQPAFQPCRSTWTSTPHSFMLLLKAQGMWEKNCGWMLLWGFLRVASRLQNIVWDIDTAGILTAQSLTSSCLSRPCWSLWQQLKERVWCRKHIPRGSPCEPNGPAQRVDTYFYPCCTCSRNSEGDHS